jgi:uncharacterized membrane protein
MSAHKHPTFGFTRHGHAVHAKTVDHMPGDTAYARFNKRLALLITANIGTMTCFWIFSVMAFMSLPATLHLVGWIPNHWILPTFFISYGFIFLISWVCQTYFQLVLLPALMVGQNLQNQAADARAAKSFEDTELVVDRLDTHTQGGITEVLDRLEQQDKAITAILAQLTGGTATNTTTKEKS